MIKIALVFVVFIALLPTPESSPVDLQPMDVLTMWRLGDYTVLCDFFCGDYDDDDDEHDGGGGAKTYLKYVEKSGVNPRIFCSICEDKKTTTTAKTTTSASSTTAASTTAGTTASTTAAPTAATT